jgi:hypothetical protein
MTIVRLTTWHTTARSFQQFREYQGNEQREDQFWS